MKYNIKQSFAVIIIFFLSWVAVTAHARLKGMPETTLFMKGEQALADKSYSSAIKYFEQIQADYPFGPDIQQAQLDLLYAYYVTGDYASAVAAAGRFIRLYPRNPHADYAYYMRGLANLKMNRTLLQKLFNISPANRDLVQVRAAFADFRMLLTLYPHSYYAPDSHQYLIYLRDILARHELGVAQYYWRREAYVAAANRASYIVRHYQHAPEVEPALVIMVKSYRNLHEDQLADQALAVLRLNFPHSPSLHKLMDA